MPLVKQQLRPGDILLLKDEPTNTTFTHKMIIAGQSLTSVNLARYHRGSADMVHAVLWVRNGGNPAEAEIAEASGTGRVRTFDLRPGLYTVYRPINENLGDWAAQVAQMWAVGGNIAYGKAMSVASIFHSDRFGPTRGGARRRAMQDRLINDRANFPELGELRIQ